MTVLFWILLLLLFYAYLGYGLLIGALGALRGPRRVVEPEQPLQVDMLVAAYNEEAVIAAKLENALSLERGPHTLQVVVVSDGSTDRTDEIVRGYTARGVRLIELQPNQGKVAAINATVPQLTGDVVVFSDANSLLRPDGVLKLLRHFGDPNVGVVCGQIGVPERGRHRSWLAWAEALYWRYDHWLKIAESRLAGAVSAQGSFYAARRELLKPLPSAVADDLVLSLQVVAQGKCIVFEPEAITEEEVTSNAVKEFGRRVRSTEQGWRGLMLMKGLLNPFNQGFYALQLFSHKVLRRLTPFLLVLFAVVSALVAGQGPFYAAVAIAQLLFYGIALLAWWLPPLRKVPGVSVPLFFVMGHAAMAAGVLNVMRGHRSLSWAPARDSDDSGGK